MALKKLKHGQKLHKNFSSGTWNTLIDGYGRIQEIFAALQRLEAAVDGMPRAGIVQVMNTESFAFNQFDVVGLDNILFTPSENLQHFKNHFAFRAKKPQSANKFAVLLEPMPAGTKRLFAALASGITICRLNVTSASHEFCSVQPGEWTQFLTGSTGTNPILYKESGTGTSKWGVIRIGGGGGAAPPRLGVITEAGGIPYLDHGQVEIYAGNTIVGSGEFLDSWNTWFSWGDLEEGLEVQVQEFPDWGKKIITNAACVATH